MSRRIRVPGEQHLVNVSTPAEANEVMHVLRTYNETANVSNITAMVLPTGITAIDTALNGGVIKQKLTIVEGSNCSGKTCLLTNLASNFAEAGYNVLYVTLDTSEDVIVERISQVTETNDSGGLISVQTLPPGSQISSIRTFLNEFEQETNEKVNVVLVDFMNMLLPDNPLSSYQLNKSFNSNTSFDLGQFAANENVTVVAAVNQPRTGHVGDLHVEEYTGNETVLSMVPDSELRRNNQCRIVVRNAQSLDIVTVEIGINPDTLQVVDLI